LCQSTLTSVAIGSATLEECIPCSGIWVKAEDFQAICGDSQSQQAAIDLPMPPSPPRESDDDDAAPVRYLKCPTCGQIMNRVDYGDASGVVVNTCRDHGIWLDHAALCRLIEQIRGGSLARAQARQAEESQREDVLAAQAQFFDRLPGPTSAVQIRNRYGHGDVASALAALVRDSLR
jgi:Zn-finger nucleic acid-binding protein